MQRKCPHCHNTIDLRTRLLYCWHGTNYPIQCQQCGKTLHPSKEPLPFWTCFCIGALSSYLSFWIYIKFIEDHFLHAIGFGACMSAIAILIIGIIVVNRYHSCQKNRVQISFNRLQNQNINNSIIYQVMKSLK